MILFKHKTIIYYRYKNVNVEFFDKKYKSEKTQNQKGIRFIVQIQANECLKSN